MTFSNYYRLELPYLPSIGGSPLEIYVQVFLPFKSWYFATVKVPEPRRQAEGIVFSVCASKVGYAVCWIEVPPGSVSRDEMVYKMNELIVAVK